MFFSIYLPRVFIVLVVDGVFPWIQFCFMWSTVLVAVFLCTQLDEHAVGLCHPRTQLDIDSPI